MPALKYGSLYCCRSSCKACLAAAACLDSRHMCSLTFTLMSRWKSYSNRLSCSCRTGGKSSNRMPFLASCRQQKLRVSWRWAFSTWQKLIRIANKEGSTRGFDSVAKLCRLQAVQHAIGGHVHGATLPQASCNLNTKYPCKYCSHLASNTLERILPACRSPRPCTDSRLPAAPPWCTAPWTHKHSCTAGGATGLDKLPALSIQAEEINDSLCCAASMASNATLAHDAFAARHVLPLTRASPCS